MAIEIERRFLVTGTEWKAEGTPELYRQGYLSVDPARTVRIRTVGEKAFLTIKGKTRGTARPEFEYEIPLADAQDMLRTLVLGPLVEKYRRTVEYAGQAWVVDEFSGRNKGLVVAEAELEFEGQYLALPPWVGTEVTSDPNYSNSRLSQRPYAEWKNMEPTE